MRQYERTNAGNVCRTCGTPYDGDVYAGPGKVWRTCILAAFVGGCLCLCAALTGCTITTKNQGETGIRYGTEITFFHRAAQTAPEAAEIRTDAPSLEHWLFDPKPVEGPPAPVTR